MSLFLKLGSQQDIFQSLNSLDYEDKNYIGFFVNNCLSQEYGNKWNNTDFGSHWSFLFYSKCDSIAYHFDSLNGLNHKDATELITNMNLKCTLLEIPVIQQRSNFECGIYAIVNCQFIVSFFLLQNRNHELHNILQNFFSDQSQNHTPKVGSSPFPLWSSQMTKTENNIEQVPHCWMIPKKTCRKQSMSNSLNESLLTMTRNRYSILSIDEADDVLTQCSYIVKKNKFSNGKKNLHFSSQNLSERKIILK